MELLSSHIKKIQKTETPGKNLLYFRKRNCLTLPKTELSHTSVNGTFLYFGKGICRTPAYLELKPYSESWSI